jgi:hypothetical protein
MPVICSNIKIQEGNATTRGRSREEMSGKRFIWSMKKANVCWPLLMWLDCGRWKEVGLTFSYSKIASAVTKQLDNVCTSLSFKHSEYRKARINACNQNRTMHTKNRYNNNMSMSFWNSLPFSSSSGTFSKYKTYAFSLIHQVWIDSKNDILSVG